MMAFNSALRASFAHTIKKGNFKLVRLSHGDAASYPAKFELQIGKREVVGYGLNGQPTYFDMPEFPMPAIRFREDTKEILALKEKEKGDWKKMSIDEKKDLYRANFCQTLVESKASTGEWKSVLGMTLLVISAGFTLFILEKIFIYEDLPASFEPATQRKQLKYMIDTRQGAITGVSSKWDYENNRWK